MSPELEAAIERMRNHVMTPEEKFEQRVSFVYGQQDYDKPGKSKDEIRQMLIDSTGYPPCQKCAALEASQEGAGDVGLHEAARDLLRAMHDGQERVGYRLDLWNRLEAALSTPSISRGGV